MNLRKGLSSIIARNAAILFAGWIGYYLFVDMHSSGNKKAFLKVIWPYLSFAFWYGWILFHNLGILQFLVNKKRYFLYFSTFLPCLLLISYFQLLALRVVWGENYTDTWVGSIFFYLFITFLGTAVYLSYRYFIDKNNYFKLESLKREIELQQLQNQLNPHFLFNSLNNIYSYALEKNKYSDVLIMKLSQVMRFIVEYSRKDKIEVEQELEFIENYIQFEQERLGERCTVHFESRISFPNKPIAPLLFFPFIENAFKYGANTITPTTIEIKIEDSTNSISMMVQNNIINKEVPSTKTGLQNTLRRLEMLYPSSHKIQISAENDVYTVFLIIKFDE